MPRPDFTSPRLYVEAPLSGGASVPLAPDQAHYLGTVLRLGPGADVLAFNGRDGEWRATFSGGKSRQTLTLDTRSRAQPASADVTYAFAPLKHARLDYMVQKAVEMGASALQPVITRRTNTSRVNAARMRANAVEAAEQCGVLALPAIRPPLRFADFLQGWPRDHLMVFCDEDAEVADPLAALAASAAGPGTPLGLLIGPEGGFDPAEREALLALPRLVRLSLGPRILRADTAAVAALALVQAVLGDGRG